MFSSLDRVAEALLGHVRRRRAYLQASPAHALVVVRDLVTLAGLGNVTGADGARRRALDLGFVLLLRGGGAAGVAALLDVNDVDHLLATTVPIEQQSSLCSAALRFNNEMLIALASAAEARSPWEAAPPDWSALEAAAKAVGLLDAQGVPIMAE